MRRFSRQQREASGGSRGAAMSPLVAVRMPRKTCRMPTATNHPFVAALAYSFFPVGALAGFDSAASSAEPVGALAGFASAATASAAWPFWLRKR